MAYLNPASVAMCGALCRPPTMEYHEEDGADVGVVEVVVGSKGKTTFFCGHVTCLFLF